MISIYLGIVTVFCVASLFSACHTATRAQEHRKILLDQINSLVNRWMNLKERNEELLNRQKELEEKCQKAKAKIKRLEKDRELRWAWNETRCCWMPTNVTGRTLMQKVPFPILAVQQKDGQEGD